jgi:hypothetical protein
MARRLLCRRVWCLLVVLAVEGSWLAASAAESTSSGSKARYTDADVARLAAAIDEHVARRWQEARVQPAPAAEDTEFLRRVYLDVIGRIPHVAEVRQFLADRSPDKRRAIVKRLLDSPAYVAHWTNVWRAALLPEADTNFQYRFLAPGFEAWVRKQLLEDRTYDQLVTGLLTAGTDNQAMQRAYAYNQGGGEPTPVAYYLAKENKPENIAGATSRLFLGLRIECAQCHKHPFAKWTREDFWGYAAFFQGAGGGQRSGGIGGLLEDLFSFPEIAIPNTNKVVQATFIDGSTPRFKGKMSFRQTLADWITSPNNPYFARAAVNRMWATLLGTGIVDPVDDFDENNQPSHPELLDLMAREFAAHEFDMKYLISAITASRPYQLTSRQTHESQKEPRHFARHAVRGLSGQQLYDSVVTATGFRDPNGRLNPFVFYGGNSPREEFLEKFKAGTENPTERTTSIVQALTVMNGSLVTSATTLGQSETLSAVIEFPFSTPQRVEALYLAALGRQPSAKELDRFARYVEQGGPKKDARAALADVFWALLNSSEFVLNH